MPALSPFVVVEFCKLCGWAYESWLNHRELFDRNPREGELKQSWAGDTLGRLNIISQEYSLLQITKLHDRPVVGGNITLGIDYVILYGGWSDPITKRLQVLSDQLTYFASKLRNVRNKCLSHNDLATIVAGATLGVFADGEDDEYFKTLQEFVNIVHDQVVGGPWPFDDLVENDVVAFLAMIKQ